MFPLLLVVLFFLFLFPTLMFTRLAIGLMRSRYKGPHRFLMLLVPSLACLIGLGVGITMDVLLLGEVFSGVGAGGVGPT